MERTYPPLIQGFIDIQKQYPNFIVLTEVGGFFEIWQLDELNLGHAERASQLLDIVLTRRDKSKLDSPKMAGFPSYAIENYVKKLVTAGETVVVVRQEIVGKKSDNNKNVKRYVERIVSPATYVEESSYSKTKYFAACYVDETNVGISLIDVSSGFVSVCEMSQESARDYLETIFPSEILFFSEPFLKQGPSQIFHRNDKPITRQSSAGMILSKIYNVENPTSQHATTLTQMGLELWPLASLSFANLLNFLVSYNPLLLKKLAYPVIQQADKSLFLSKNAFLSLDIFESPLQPDVSKTLYGILNRCKTAMGRRVLSRWIYSPLVEKDAINGRLDKVSKFISEQTFFENLSEVYDIARILRRLAINSVEPHELPAFYNSLKIASESLKTWENGKEVKAALKFLSSNFDTSSVTLQGNEYFKLFAGPLRNSLKDQEEAWASAREALNGQTSRISEILSTTKLRISEKQDSQALTGPKSLADQCKKNGISFKLKASELQITDQAWESSAFEEMSAKNALMKQAGLSWIEFQNEIVDRFGTVLTRFSEAVGELDVLSTFAKLSKERGYTRPNFIESESTQVSVYRMRHPVLELSKDSFESFIPNDIVLDKKSILVLYGANSAGKSTILKGLALNIIMAQIGCYVAASKANLSIFDSIMTRMTTFDSLGEGLSTFTMEMIELQNALKRSSEQSLFLFDEIGRGTSVEDGEAIAFGILEFLNNNPVKAITFFATHYHSLYEHIKNFGKVDVKHFDCEIVGSNLVFSRELKSGPGSGSYGLAVAKTCGVPESIIRVSQNYKKNLSKLMVSRYNASVQGTLCELCKVNEAQETHHIQEQLQGKKKSIRIAGVDRSIHDNHNLVLLCGSCHKKVTAQKLVLKKRRAIGSDNFVIEVDEKASLLNKKS